MNTDISVLTEKAARAECLRLFLDYDGTLAEFVPTPDIIRPRDELISLIARLADSPGVLPAVISGRRLADIEQLLPVPDLLLGGAYGIEMKLPDGSLRTARPLNDVRARVEEVLARWSGIIEGLDGFFLEDKGWTAALHGRYADEVQAVRILGSARLLASELLSENSFRLLGGDRFLEFAPVEASKSAAVRWVLDNQTPPDAVVVCLGDDDKDEEAFETILAAGGTPVRITESYVETRADYRLGTPVQVRAWLAQLLEKRGG